ncbi:MAG: acyl carrier protein [Lachnospiraceae bacterium]|nr:acyl carrier protein [Lachnospiraceae bacterium]MBR1523607.1 acyl carrier protein [Lachnospiraceae bacterium]
MREKVLEILYDIRSNIEYETETALVTENILDSFDIIGIISRLNDEFDIEISAKEITAVNFDSVDSITALVERTAKEEAE